MAELSRPVVLCGVKHCGKSTLGALLAKRWGVPFFDTDSALEKRYRAEHPAAGSATVRGIYRALGAEAFRRLESEVVAELAALPCAGRVVATGGGVFSNGNIPEATLKKLGFCVFLEIDSGLAFRRVMRRGVPPFFAEAADPRAEFERMNRERCEVFQKYAALTVPIEREVSAFRQAEVLARRIAECGVL